MSEREFFIKNALFREPEKTETVQKHDIEEAGLGAAWEMEEILYLCRIGCREPAPHNPENIYRICHAVTKQYDIDKLMRATMGRRWGAQSMREMSLPALQDLFYYVRGLERLKKGF